MKCPECGKEMRNGYLFCSKDGAFSFANEVPGVFTDAKKADGFVKVTEVKPSHRTNIAASICENCKTVILQYQIMKDSRVYFSTILFFFTHQFVAVGHSTC